MYVEDEVGHRTSTVEVEDWRDAYGEIKDILENRFGFDRVKEEKFRHHKKKGIVVSKISVYEELDSHTETEITVVLTVEIDDPDTGKGTMTIDSKGQLVTRYGGESSWQRHPLYYALRSIWHKLVYGWTRGQWEENSRETLENVHASLRGAFKTVEA